MTRVEESADPMAQRRANLMAATGAATPPSPESPTGMACGISGSFKDASFRLRN